MNTKKLLLQIVFWVEVVIALRLLLFSLPVIISRYVQHNMEVNNIADFFIFSLTIIALLYFIVGIASILGHKLWRIFHYLAATVVICLTFALIRNLIAHNMMGSYVYLLPTAISLMLTVSIFVLSFSKTKVA